MQLYKYPGREEWEAIIRRPEDNDSLLSKNVKKILKQVKEKGDKAIRKLSKKYDGVSFKKLAVSDTEINDAGTMINDELKFAIDNAKHNIATFHNAQKDKEVRIQIMPGITCWRRSVPIEKIGLYIPGGTAPLFSSVLMLATPAAIAGCKEIILCSPPDKNGSIHPAILYTAKCCGVTKIFKVGGAQAIAAMAYGTESIPKVFKIFGPGNQYVTTAKQIVQQDVSIDLPAGPSEILVIADDTCIPAFVAADLLSQAEHGKNSQVILLTTSESVAEKVVSLIKEQSKRLTRKDLIEGALQNSRIIILNTLSDAIELSNRYAPEHLIICCNNAEEIAGQVTAAGSIFIGNYSPESAGDYASGTNHTLPTNGYAAMYSGVSLDSFVKKITIQQLTKEGLQNIGNTIMEMASAEGLDAHKNSVAIRLN